MIVPGALVPYQRCSAGATSDEVTAMPLAPSSFGTNTIADYRFAQNVALTTVTLPKATGGLAPPAYSLAKTTGSPAVPPGLTFTASSRQLSGTPTTLQTATEYTYTVTDSSTPANTATLTFDIAVEPESMPSLGAVTDRSFYQGSAIADVVLPAATGGNAPLIYTLAKTTATQSAAEYTYTTPPTPPTPALTGGRRSRRP